ncbi:MAG TPA: hypothetical protein VHW47_10225 [Acidimicrobiales bacterium]|jgi:hypothetical protein|nr:hypothetical protein [Acidimicrobiales bacterium]
MFKKIVTGVLIVTGLYIVVANATGSGTLLTDATTGFVKGEKALQGRT